MFVHVIMENHFCLKIIIKKTSNYVIVYKKRKRKPHMSNNIILWEIKISR